MRNLWNNVEETGNPNCAVSIYCRGENKRCLKHYKLYKHYYKNNHYLTSFLCVNLIVL